VNGAQPMNRDFARLEGGPFDLLVVGGGIYGAWIAYDAALRGLRTALVERDDWAAGTSSASSKLIHGGLRYLEHLKVGLVKRALAERRRLATLAPHRVHPLRFVVPAYRGDRVGPLRLEAGLWLYDRLAGPHQPVPPHQAFGRSALLDTYGFLAPAGLKAGFSYGDCGTDDARFTLEIVAGALSAGAACVNGAEVVELVREGSRVAGAVVLDRETGRSADVRARVTVNAAGPWGARIKGLTPEARGLVRLVKGVHLLLPALPTADALLLSARRDGRVFFAIPWYGRTLLGTTDTDFSGDPDDAEVVPGDVEYLLTEAARALQPVGWTGSDIVGGFAGVRALRSEGHTRPADVTREWTLEAPEPGLLMPVGGKFTSARAEASITVQAAMAGIGRAPGQCPTKRRAFPWRPVTDFRHFREETAARGTALGLDAETAAGCAARYGTTVEALFGVVGARPELARRIVPDLPFCAAEVVHAVRAEMARTLTAVLRRRIPLALLHPLDRETVAACADLAGAELGWSPERRGRETEEVLAHVRLPRA
jgi:glycerol-3-phosphate dehydrogenase